MWPPLMLLALPLAETTLSDPEIAGIVARMSLADKVYLFQWISATSRDQQVQFTS